MDLPEITESEIIEATKNALCHTEFRLLSYNVSPASDNPLGFLGDHLRITAKVQVTGSPGEKADKMTLHFFAKQMPTKVKSHYDYANATGAFYKEIQLFKTLFDDMKKSRSKIIQKYLPDFYYERKNQLMIIEDLSVINYEMVPERSVLDLNHLKIAMEAVARLHASSFIFEEKYRRGLVVSHSTAAQQGGCNKKSATIADLYPNLLFETEASDVPGHPGNSFWEAGIQSQVSIVDLLPGLSLQARERIRKELPGTLRKALQFVKPSKRFPNVLLHGDLWCNNLMFLYDDNHIPTNCVIVDFQLARYGPPAHDLIMLLYLTQTRAFREQHQHELLQHYYETLAEELKSEGIDINHVHPRSEFERSIDYYREYGILNNIMYFQLILMPGEITKEFLSSPELFDKNMLHNRSDMIVACYEKDDLCRMRVTEAMQEAIDFYHWV